MMIILTQEEYNELIKKASSVDILVEERVQIEKDRIWKALQEGCKSFRTETLRNHPIEAIRSLLSEILR